MGPSSTHNSQSPNSVVHSRGENTWSDLSPDVIELIFARLPEASVLRAASVCKRWYSVTQMPSFAEFYKRHRTTNLPNRYVFKFAGVKYAFSESFDGKGGFRFHRVEEMDTVPTFSCSEDGVIPTIEAAGGLHLAFTGVKETTLRYKLSLVEKNWRTTPDMPSFLQDPVVGVVEGVNDGRGHNVVVAGGLCSNAEEGEDMAVLIYDDEIGSWGCCAPLPSEFIDWRISSLSMAAIVHKNRFYIYDVYLGLVSWLDMESKRWSAVVQLRPSAKVSKVFLVSLSGVLRLVGVEEALERDVSFKVWNVVDEMDETMRVGEILHSSIIRNAYGAPLSPIQRWASTFIEVSLSIIAVLLFLFVQFEVNCCKAGKSAIRFLHSQSNSTAALVRNQFSLKKLGTD